MILASKLSDLEQFENFATINQFIKQKRVKMTSKSNLYHRQALKKVFLGKVTSAWK